MIDRYTTKEMRALWSPQNKTQRWLDVEIAVCDGLERFGQIPEGTTAKIRAGARFVGLGERQQLLELIDEQQQLVRRGREVLADRARERLG